MIVSIYINNEQLDLFKDENISVTSSVLDIQDINKNTTDYSNSFTVPASDNNNKIFKHYYNANIDNTFDARLSVSGRIEIGGLPFRTGKILLQKVSVKSNVASSYTINFWGNLVSLKDVLGDDKLSKLDLSIYNHVFSYLNVVTYLQNYASSYPYIYNLLVKKKYHYSSDPTDVTMTDTQANIHYEPGTVNGFSWDELRPSLRLIKIIEAIESDYGLTFSRDFFGRNEFNELFIWLSNTVDSKVGGETKIVDFKTPTSPTSPYINDTTNIGTFYTKGIPGETTSEYWYLRLTITPDAGFNDVEYVINFYSDTDVLAGSVRGSGVTFIDSYLSAIDKTNTEHTYYSYWEIVPTAKLDYSAECIQRKQVGVAPTLYYTYGDDSLDSYVTISDNLPDMKILDFIKGLFSAFKLVVIPQDDGTIYVNTINSYYSQGSIIDITAHVDVESVDVSRGSILNEISYEFKDPQTILNKTFKENYILGYGDEDAQLKDENGKLLDGNKLEVKVPFEQMVYERLTDINVIDDINLMYGAVIDKSLEPVNIKPHIFYNQRKAVGGDGIGMFDEDGNKIPITAEINTASHVIDDNNPTHSFIFSSEANNFTGEIITNTLYSNYHQDYINNLFNIKRRNFTYKSKILPVPILLELSLNDVLKIGYNYFRIDKFTTDLVSGETELNLVNSSE